MKVTLQGSRADVSFATDSQGPGVAFSKKLKFVFLLKSEHKLCSILIGFLEKS